MASKCPQWLTPSLLHTQAEHWKISHTHQGRASSAQDSHNPVVTSLHIGAGKPAQSVQDSRLPSKALGSNTDKQWTLLEPVISNIP